ncbi:MAG: peptidase domain-containing ABC transporter [Pseudomonas sp.]
MADGSSIVPWSIRSRVDVVMQTEAAECALACIAMIAQYHGNETGLPALRRRFSSTLRGMSLDRVIEVADNLGFDCRALRAELEYLSHIKGPAILHWDMNHFVVLAEAKSNWLVIMDPALGRRTMSREEVSKHFTGVLLELSPTASFKKIEAPPKLPLSALTGKISGLRRSLLQVISLALAIELLGLCIPLQAQWTIDQFHSPELVQISTVAAIFIIIVVMQAALSAARGWLISWIGANISAQWITNIFGHLMRLPLEFFEKRHLGDVLSRFTSVHSIQDTLTGSFVTALLDGLTSVLALAMIFVYSKTMAMVAIGVASVYALTRLAIFKSLWRANEERVVFQARQQTELMESVRGIQAIKLANTQAERRTRLANATVEAAKRDIKGQRIQLGFAAASQGLFGLQRVFLLAGGTYLISAGSISAGMLVAILAYVDQFSTRVGSFIDKGVELGMLRLHLDRIADIATAEEEPTSRISPLELSSPPTIEVSGLGYRYSEWEPWIFRGLDFSIESGQSVAFIGPSGCGKTTLAKIILGLNAPQEGEISIAGISHPRGGSGAFGGLMAAVMQDDCLFSGTIADNISFFDAASNMDDIQSAAHAAGIHGEIMVMPMRYETLVGDMGSTLSGGQKQRVLLARALYRKPKVLVLDEATSHLDSLNERIANDAVRALNITRIIIAHRKETIDMADRVYDLSKREWLR